MKKLVYLSPLLSAENYGGSVVAHANLKAVKDVFKGQCLAVSLARMPAEHDVYVKPSGHRAFTALCNFFGLAAGLTPAGVVQIVRLCRQRQPDVVWLDTSFLGVLIPLLRLFCKRSKFAVFVHDAEPPMVLAKLRRNPLYVISWAAIRANEALSFRLADAVFAIQPNDARLIRERGARHVDVIRVSLTDQAAAISPTDAPNLQRSYLLFVGSDFAPNIEAMAYMNDVLAPLLGSTKIHCVGNGLEKYATRFRNLVVTGRVADLSPSYRSALAVLAPVFSGGGMKVKIAEALMYNRHVVCSPFASLGYENSIGRAVWVAETPQAFADAIHQLAKADEFLPRNEYLAHYSPDSLRRSVSSALSGLGLVDCV